MTIYLIYTISCKIQVSQKLVSINPCSSESLYLLGMSQLLIFDNDNGMGVANETSLLEARQSLEASIALEGKPASGDTPPGIIGNSPVNIYDKNF